MIWISRLAKLSLLIFLLLTSYHVTNAALPYPFEGLLPRAETVFIGRIKSHTAQNVTFEIMETLRGGLTQNTLTLRYSGYDDRKLSEVSTPCLVISQGDNHFGKPESIVSLGQYVKGQAGYCGWIAFPIRSDGDVLYLDLIDTRVGQKPGEKPARLTLDEAKILIQGYPYRPDLHGNGVQVIAPERSKRASHSQDSDAYLVDRRPVNSTVGALPIPRNFLRGGHEALTYCIPLVCERLSWPRD
jgi:hypothetical protein